MVTVATGAGVLARQAVAPPLEREQDGNRAASVPPGAGDADNPARSVTTDDEEPNLKEDATFDRLESLNLDVELLTNEVNSLKGMLTQYSKSIVSANTGFEDLVGGDAEQTEQLRGQALKHVESMKRRMTELRKDYLAKSKELRQKQRQLSELQVLQRSQELGNRQRNTMLEPNMMMPGNDQRALASRPAASKSQGISPALEQRLSGMEQKLDQIKKALDVLRREQGR